jgi:hypothetical protein
MGQSKEIVCCVEKNNKCCLPPGGKRASNIIEFQHITMLEERIHIAN